MNSWARATRAQGEKEEVNLFVVRGPRPRNFLGVRSDHQLDSRPLGVRVHLAEDLCSLGLGLWLCNSLSRVLPGLLAGGGHGCLQGSAASARCGGSC